METNIRRKVKNDFRCQKKHFKTPISDFNFSPIYVKLYANPCYITPKFIFAIKFLKELSHILRMLFTLLKISGPRNRKKKPNTGHGNHFFKKHFNM